jgi:hypothetical protein
MNYLFADLVMRIHRSMPQSNCFKAEKVLFFTNPSFDIVIKILDYNYDIYRFMHLNQQNSRFLNIVHFVVRVLSRILFVGCYEFPIDNARKEQHMIHKTVYSEISVLVFQPAVSPVVRLWPLCFRCVVEGEVRSLTSR